MYVNGGDDYKLALYAYRAARLALVEDSFSQPGNVHHRPSLIGIWVDGDHTAVLKQFQDRKQTIDTT